MKKRRRKDDGFTLIELMIVIAVIGILAIVLIPKAGAVKTQAKLTGVDANLRNVEGYVQSRISVWANGPSPTSGTGPYSESDIANEIYTTYNGYASTTPAPNALVNPFTQSTAVNNGVPSSSGATSGDVLDIVDSNNAPSSSGSGLNGNVVVVITMGSSAVQTIQVMGFDTNGQQENSVTIQP